MEKNISCSIRGDITFMQFVIPGLTRNPVFSGFPLEFIPMEIGTGMTTFIIIVKKC